MWLLGESSVVRAEHSTPSIDSTRRSAIETPIGSVRAGTSLAGQGIRSSLNSNMQLK